MAQAIEHLLSSTKPNIQSPESPNLKEQRKGKWKLIKRNNGCTGVQIEGYSYTEDIIPQQKE
jgi:hypothetical protein